MSYTYVTAHARSRNDASRLDEVDIGHTDLNDVFRTYSEIYVTLTHGPTEQTVYLNLNDVRAMMGLDTRFRTIVSWLTDIGNTALPTITTLPNMTARRAYYNEVYRAGYDVLPVDMNRHHDSPISRTERRDLLLRKEGVDFNHWWRYCMVTVNGMFHRVSGSADGLYVLNGNRSAQIANKTMVGLLSFREVGPMRTIPITPGMVYKNNPDQQYRNYAYVKLPESIEQKTVFLVLGGYLHAMDGQYTMLNDRVVRIDFNNLLLPDRIYDSRDRIDLSSLQLPETDHNEQHFGLDDLYSDQRILAYLTLSQSFFVVFDSPHLYTRRHYVENTGLPGRFLTSMPMPRYPLFSALGRCYDYLWFPKDDRVVLATEENHQHRYLFATGQWRGENSLDDTRYRPEPWEFAHGHMLEIGRV